MNAVKMVERSKHQTPKLPALYFNFGYVCVAFNSFWLVFVGERTESCRLPYANLKSFMSYMLLKQRLQSSSLHLPSSFDGGYTPTEGEGDGVRKAQFIVDLQPKTQVEDCS